MAFTFLVMMVTLGAGVTEAGKLVYAISQTQDEVVCPDGKKQCSDDSTCCKLTSGQWGCCPYADATCCSDNAHCCPQGYICDASGRLCHHAAANKTMTWAKKLPASFKSKQAVEESENAICPGGIPCLGSCCKNRFGGYSCCPFTGCCPGGITGCCPGGDGRRATYLKSTEYASKVEWSLIGEEAN